MSDDDQDKLAEEWAAALESLEEGGVDVDDIMAGATASDTTGGGTGGSGPDLSMASLTQGNTDRNAALGNVVNLDNYIKESVRTPNAFAVSPYSPLMTAYPNNNDMPDEDLATITQYLKTL